MLRRFSYFLFSFLTFYVLRFTYYVSPIFAVPIDPPNNRGGYFSQTYPTITGLIGSLLKNSLTIAGVLLLCLLIFGGFSFIMSAGQNDPKKTAMAQAMITDAVIGFLVVILAYFIVQIVEVVTGVNILNPTF